MLHKTHKKCTCIPRKLHLIEVNAQTIKNTINTSFKGNLFFKGEVQFLHLKPHNKDIYDHIQCSAALL